MVEEIEIEDGAILRVHSVGPDLEADDDGDLIEAARAADLHPASVADLALRRDADALLRAAFLKVKGGGA